jgi:methionyl-tRNA formyltransferase
MNNDVKLILMADKVVGAKVCKFLLEQYPNDLALVVTTDENDLFSMAKSARVPVIVFEGQASLLDHIRAKRLDFDLGILAWWPNIIKPPLISLPRHGFINLHPSLLPYNRGKHYNFWAIVEENPFGVSIHFVDEGVDSGDIVVQRVIPYDWTDTGETLYYKAQTEMVNLFCTSYPMLRTLSIDRTPQDSSQGSFHRASELEPASKIDLEGQYKCRELLNLLRARTFNGHPACRFEHSGKEYEVRIEIRQVDK